MFGTPTLLTLALASSVIASSVFVDRRSFEAKGGVNYTVFEHATTRAKISFVNNSGICETTPGVNQFSGYVSVGTSMNMFFWFFEARNNHSTAPLALWLAGGPGCSSMAAVFVENGPCTFNNVSGLTPVLNPYSWNNVANVLYIDQPIGAGFSFGADDATSTVTAAPFVWKFLQAFYTRFPAYKNRNFGLFTESYGGHFGPEFASYFESRNSAIDRRKITGVKIPLVALGINSGWFDPALQFKAYIDYALTNPYRALINSSQAVSYLDAYNKDCLPALNACNRSRSNSDCKHADDTCPNQTRNAIFQDADFDIDDIRAPSDDPFPPGTYIRYLQTPKIQKAIGARVQYQDCPDAPFQKFATTGDAARSFLSTLSEVIQSGVQVLIWAGDADWNCNTAGVQAVVSRLTFPESSSFNTKSLTPYTVGGVQYGTFKTAGKLSFLNVFGAGHAVPAYQPVVALQVFTQTINQQPLSST